jgi:hypothetical protein
MPDSTARYASPRLAFAVIDVPPGGAETSYYVRVTQEDGHQPWSSPIWVNGP